MLTWRCRRSRRLLGLLAVAAGLNVQLAPSQTAPVTYGISDIGMLGSGSAEGHGISEFGQTLVGRAQTGAGSAYHAFVLSYFGRKDLGTLGGSDSIALAASGAEIVGRARLASGAEHAFLADTYSTRPMLDLGTLGGTSSVAYDLRYGYVVGASQTAGDARLQAFVYESGAMSALPVSLGGDSVAKAVSDSHDVAGYACTAGNASCRAFVLSGGALTMLGSLGGNSVANDLNAMGQVAGTSWLADQKTTRAFVHQGGVMTSLGTLGGVNSEAFAINERGQIVGAANTAAGAVRAFLWQAGVMIDLNTLIPDGSGWVLVSARGISEGGQIVGTGTLNGVTRGFLLTPPIDLELRTGGVKSQSDSNLPRGVEVGKTIRFVFSAQALAMDGLTVYGARITDTLTGPAEYVSATTNGDATCTVTPKTVTCDLEAVDSIGLGREIMLTVRTTAPGAIAHTAVVSSSVPDPNAANDSVTEENRAVALATLALTPSSIPGGKASSARVTLTGQAPQSDAVVRLWSSRPDIAPVPATLIVPSWTNTRAFNIIPAVVAAATTVEISASYGLVTQQATLTVLPPALAQLYLTPTTIVGGCGTSAGKIVLTGAAPAGGAVIPVANTNGNALVPSSVTVAAGTTTKTFTVPTKTVTSPTVGSVTAAYGGVSQTLTVTVRPIRVKTLTFSPNPVKGGTAVTGTIVLECPAAPGAVVVTLTGGSATTAAPSVTSVTIPAGATTATFPVGTAVVSANTTVTIYATVFGVRKGAALTVTP